MAAFWTWSSTVFLMQLAASLAMAHGGGLDSSGCHNDRKRGGYHCHRSGYTPRLIAPQPEPTPQPAPQRFYQGGAAATPSTTRPTVEKQLKFKRITLAVQQSLNAFGYFDGPFNGNLGPKTKEALRRFQVDYGLSPTGTITPQVLRIMDIQM